ncbi:aldo/keto reductase [Saccharothrix coeruleofusca]|uniref:Oxidoreductase n=1 Tax=Saccharothrix coeruleofusca TaxID=33919 RepID=A0A918ANC1_9PSEU|nr:aldo/keto reductase [Saccharothrix coeruleofusca]GGP62319.1 oxidoreductase [Saccharothrix coeruleofusca]
MTAMSRRAVLQAGAATTLAAATGATATAAAQPTGDLITRRVPRGGEVVPAIGMGTFMTFDKRPGAERGHLREVLDRFWRGGGRVLDTSPMYGLAEVTVGDLAADLGIAGGLFLTGKTWVTGEHLGDDSHARRQFEQSLNRLWRDRIDLVQVHSLTNVGTVLPVLRAWKREGRIRYFGVSHHEPAYFPIIEQLVRDGDMDFVQVGYSIRNRVAETSLLPAAVDHGTAVLVNTPLEKARLHDLVRDRPLPGFAAEFGARNWAQFFLKYVLAHPAVTCALPATTDPDHMSENLGAMRGPLPDQRTRQRMVRHMEAIPGFADLLDRPWYPGKTFDGVVRLP